MSNVKTISKGEYVFKEGDKVSALILIQSGAIQLCISRPKKNIDLGTLGAGQIIGEQTLMGGVYPFSGMATVETKYLELPGELYKQQIESAPQILKMVVKSLTDRMKTALQDVRAARMEKDATPCPEDQVAKVFGSIFFTAKHKGEHDPKVPNTSVIEWHLFRQYAQRVFGESLKRLEQATHILVKMKLASYEMGKAPDNPDGPDEIQRLHVSDLAAVEAFFEFFQYYYFKGGKADLLKSDEMATSILIEVLKLAEPLDKDRFGVVGLEYSKVIEAFKNDLGMTLNNDHWSRLESKGLYVKRQPRADGQVWFSFELAEFQVTAKIWRILREIEKWNEKGFVDLNEDLSKPKKKGTGTGCPQCAADVPAQAKFCPECGHKLEIAKAS